MEILSHLAPDNNLVFELYDVAGREYFDRMASCIPHFDVSLSILSHDEELRRFCGKDFENEDIERNITWAFESGCERFDLVLVLGLPGQTPELIMESLDFCGTLMRRFGPKLNPTLRAIAPMLAPGTYVHGTPARLGYNLLYEELEDHETAMLQPNWRDSLNYETRWMDRQTFTDTAYMALLRLNELKAKHGVVTHHKANAKERHVRNSLAILKLLDEMGGSAFEDPKLHHDVEQVNRAFAALAYMEELKAIKHFRHLRVMKMAMGRS
jgi:radical SAM superfamily enzyme YgiQ (UPF0313 family)